MVLDTLLSSPPVGDLARRLGALTIEDYENEFRMLGEKMRNSLGPMPGESDTVCCAGLYPIQKLGMSEFNQKLIYNIFWAGKVFHEDTTKSFDTQYEKEGRFYLTNKLLTVIKPLTLVPDGTKAWVYRSSDSWINDGNPTIIIDYAPSVLFSWWIHDEIRFAGFNDNGTACYQGIAWAFLGNSLKAPLAYFIIDQVTTAREPKKKEK